MSPRDVQQALLTDAQQEEKALRRLWEGHLEALNPEARGDYGKHEWTRIAWEFAAVVAFLGFLGWLLWWVRPVATGGL